MTPSVVPRVQVVAPARLVEDGNTWPAVGETGVYAVIFVEYDGEQDVDDELDVWWDIDAELPFGDRRVTVTLRAPASR